MKHTTTFGKKELALYETELRAVGLKVTSARVAVLNCFSRGCEPQSAETISQELSGNDIDTVTIYRTLTSLEKAGIIRRIDLRKDAVFFERGEHHHHHIVCTMCGKTEQFDGCKVSEIGKNVLRKSKLFTSFADHSLEFFGVCKKCTTV